jgi:hypothetical protein
MVASQPYTILEELSGSVELRHYPAHTLISVDVAAPFQNAGTRAFGRSSVTSPEPTKRVDRLR